MICTPPFGGKSASVFKGFAVGTFAFGRVYLVADHFNAVKCAAVTVFAMVSTVVYITADVFIGAHNKNLLFVLLLFFSLKHCLFKKVLFRKKSS